MMLIIVIDVDAQDPGGFVVPNGLWVFEFTVPICQTQS